MNNRKSLLRLLLLVSFCLATVTLHAQVINKTFKNETLKTVLKEVEQQTGLSVSYTHLDVYKRQDKAENACCQTENFYLCIEEIYNLI